MAEAKKPTKSTKPTKTTKKPAAKKPAQKKPATATPKVAKIHKAASTNLPKIRIRLKAYDHRVIDQSARQIVNTAIRTGAEVSGPVPLPTKRSTFTVVKSPHVYKTGGEAFEMKIHKRLIDIINATPKTIDSLQNLSLPAGVDAEIKM